MKNKRRTVSLNNLILIHSSVLFFNPIILPSTLSMLNFKATSGKMSMNAKCQLFPVCLTNPIHLFPPHNTWRQRVKRKNKCNCGLRAFHILCTYVLRWSVCGVVCRGTSAKQSTKSVQHTTAQQRGSKWKLCDAVWSQKGWSHLSRLTTPELSGREETRTRVRIYFYYHCLCSHQPQREEGVGAEWE